MQKKGGVSKQSANAASVSGSDVLREVMSGADAHSAVWASNLWVLIGGERDNVYFTQIKKAHKKFRFRSGLEAVVGEVGVVCV